MAQEGPKGSGEAERDGSVGQKAHTTLPSLELTARSSKAGGTPCSPHAVHENTQPTQRLRKRPCQAACCGAHGCVRVRLGGGCTALGSGSPAARARAPSRRVSCRAPCPRPPHPSASPAPGWLPPLSHCPPASGYATPQSAGGGEAGPGAAPGGVGESGQPRHLSRPWAGPQGPSTPESCGPDPRFPGHGGEGYLLGPAEGPTAVHVVLGVHDEHHLVRAELEAAVHIAGALHPDQTLPGALGLATQGAHLLTLPPAELLEVPGGREEDLQTRKFLWSSNTGKLPDFPGSEECKLKQCKPPPKPFNSVKTKGQPYRYR